MKFAAALLAATATANLNLGIVRDNRTAENCATQYTEGSYKYNQCVKSLGLQNLFDFTADIDVDGQYARNCTVNCANRTTYETAGAVYQNLGAFRKSRTAENCATQYTEGSYKYNQCVKSFGLQNLFDFTADIDVDGQYAPNCTVNCANRTTYETSSGNGAAYQNLSEDYPDWYLN